MSIINYKNINHQFLKDLIEALEREISTTKKNYYKNACIVKSLTL